MSESVFLCLTPESVQSPLQLEVFTEYHAVWSSSFITERVQDWMTAQQTKVREFAVFSLSVAIDDVDGHAVLPLLKVRQPQDNQFIVGPQAAAADGDGSASASKASAFALSYSFALSENRLSFQTAAATTAGIYYLCIQCSIGKQTLEIARALFQLVPPQHQEGAREATAVFDAHRVSTLPRLLVGRGADGNLVVAEEGAALVRSCEKSLRVSSVIVPQKSSELEKEAIAALNFAFCQDNTERQDRQQGFAHVTPEHPAGLYIWDVTNTDTSAGAANSHNTLLTFIHDPNAAPSAVSPFLLVQMLLSSQVLFFDVLPTFAKFFRSCTTIWDAMDKALANRTLEYAGPEMILVKVRSFLDTGSAASANNGQQRKVTASEALERFINADRIPGRPSLSANLDRLFCSRAMVLLPAATADGQLPDDAVMSRTSLRASYTRALSDLRQMIENSHATVKRDANTSLTGPALAGCLLECVSALNANKGNLGLQFRFESVAGDLLASIDNKLRGDALKRFEEQLKSLLFQTNDESNQHRDDAGTNSSDGAPIPVILEQQEFEAQIRELTGLALRDLERQCKVDAINQVNLLKSEVKPIVAVYEKMNEKASFDQCRALMDRISSDVKRALDSVEETNAVERVKKLATAFSERFREAEVQWRRYAKGPAAQKVLMEGMEQMVAIEQELAKAAEDAQAQEVGLQLTALTLNRQAAQLVVQELALTQQLKDKIATTRQEAADQERLRQQDAARSQADFERKTREFQLLLQETLTSGAANEQLLEAELKRECDSQQIILDGDVRKWDQQISLLQARINDELENHRTLDERCASTQDTINKREAARRASQGGGGGCFSLDHGSCVIEGVGEAPLRDLRVGDRVACFNRSKTEVIFAAVLQMETFHDVLDSMLVIHGSGGSCLHITPSHLVYCRCSKGGGRWSTKPAGLLREGDEIYESNKVSTVRLVECTTVYEAPIAILTEVDSIIVSGFASSCHEGSEWVGWVDTLDVKLLHRLAPGVLKSPIYKSVRCSLDKVSNRISYWIADLRNQYLKF